MAGGIIIEEKVLWIAVTGLDGSGKTTLVDNLEKWFSSNIKNNLQKSFATR